MYNPELEFGPYTKSLLDVAGIIALPQLIENDPDKLARQYSHLLLDVDGVVRPYGEDISTETREWLSEAHTSLPDGISLLSNSSHPLDVGDIPTSFRRGASIKQLPWVINGHIRRFDINAESTLGIGDGLTDILAYRFARIGNVALVKSQGAHNFQEIVHKRIYGPFLRKTGHYSRAFS